MSFFKGKKLTVEIFGASHDENIGVIIDGLPPVKTDQAALKAFMERRRAKDGVYSTARREPDEPVFFGVEDGVTGKRVKAVIKNKDVLSADYGNLYGKPRPGHADFASFLKDGTLDFRGGGRFSGRMTAPLCVAGGILKQYLESRGVYIRAYVSEIGAVKARSYLDKGFDAEEAFSIKDGAFPSIDKSEEMLSSIREARSVGDSVGGVIECVVKGFPAGVGDCLFDGLEGKISSLVFAVPAVKGVEFGLGFLNAKMLGSQTNDQMEMENGAVKFLSNGAGGINGGISNGNTILLRAAIKPTPSIIKEQKTIDLVRKESCVISVSGRHDACIVPRAVPAIEAAVAIALADEII